MSFPLLAKLGICEKDLWIMMLEKDVSINACFIMKKSGVILKKHVVHVFNFASERNLSLTFPDDFQDEDKFK